VVLSQRPTGVGAGELARLADAPPTSVQNTLRLLVVNGLVSRRASRYFLSTDHPAVAEVVAVGLRLAPPQDALLLVIRASEYVEFASLDEAGFVIGTRTNPDPDSASAFEAAIATIRRDREDVPVMLRFETEELARILQSAVGLRTRIAAAHAVKGIVRRPGPLAMDRHTDGPGRSTRK
jgi:hypothetical protein